MRVHYNSSGTGRYRWGFQGQEKDDAVKGAGNSYTAEFWRYDARLARRWNIDPVEKFNESPYLTFSNSPIWLIDPNGADTAIFDSDNKFVEVKPGGEHVGKKLGENGFMFSFADPENDIAAIKNGIINELFIADEEVISEELDRVGVNEDENRGFIDGPLFLKDNSNATMNSGKLDFVLTSEIFGKQEVLGQVIGLGLPGNRLYITKISDNVLIGHNNFNFGNFLWGASANAVEVSLELSLIAAHVNNYVNDQNNQGKSLTKRELDSKDDQLSILLGWIWNANR